MDVNYFQVGNEFIINRKKKQWKVVGSIVT